MNDQDGGGATSDDKSPPGHGNSQSHDHSKAAATPKRARLRKKAEKTRPNINKNGHVIFTFFAGVESISGSVELSSLVPLEPVENIKADHVPTNPFSAAMLAANKKKQSLKNEQNKYQTFLYNVMTKIRQVYNIRRRVEILDDQLRTQFRLWLETADKLHKEQMDKKS